MQKNSTTLGGARFPEGVPIFLGEILWGGARFQTNLVWDHYIARKNKVDNWSSLQNGVPLHADGLLHLYNAGTR